MAILNVDMNCKLALANAIKSDFARAGIVSENRHRANIDGCLVIIEEVFTREVNQLGYINLTPEKEERLSTIFNSVVQEFENIVVEATSIAEKSFRERQPILADGEEISIEAAMKAVIEVLVSQSGMSALWQLPPMRKSEFFVE
jgi:hypothetical protein